MSAVCRGRAGGAIAGQHCRYGGCNDRAAESCYFENRKRRHSEREHPRNARAELDESKGATWKRIRWFKLKALIEIEIAFKTHEYVV